MHIFAEIELRDYLEQKKLALKSEVESANRDDLLNVNEIQYVQYLCDRHKVEPLVLDFEGMSVDHHENMIPAERFPQGSFAVRAGERYKKQVIEYYLPFIGDKELLRCNPSHRILWTTEVNVKDNHVCFEIVNWSDKIEELERKADDVLQGIRQQYEYVATEVKQHCDSFEGHVKQIVQARKALLLKQSNTLAALGVPFRKSEQTPATFAVPGIVKKQVVIKSTAPSTAFKPEPALDETVYGDILSMIHQFGREMERHPSIYQEKNEEALRDQFIMVLSPNFHSVTGETFNKTGKTDILIRHEGTNVFVAECLFWVGIKSFSEKIDQLLGYLTWRDSKTAVICFVKNKELNPVLEQVGRATGEHSCHVKSLGKPGEGWFNFEFHLKNDNSRGVKLAVLCFHLPEMGK